MLLFLFIKVVILMMKLKYSICCGLDVHKNVIVATIVITNKDGISQTKIFFNHQLGYPKVSQLAHRESLLSCLYGIHRKVLDSYF